MLQAIRTRFERLDRCFFVDGMDGDLQALLVPFVDDGIKNRALQAVGPPDIHTERGDLEEIRIPVLQPP